jgi:hypothetical protein
MCPNPKLAGSRSAQQLGHILDCSPVAQAQHPEAAQASHTCWQSATGLPSVSATVAIRSPRGISSGCARRARLHRRAGARSHRDRQRRCTSQTWNRRPSKGRNVPVPTGRWLRQAPLPRRRCAPRRSRARPGREVESVAGNPATPRIAPLGRRLTCIRRETLSRPSSQRPLGSGRQTERCGPLREVADASSPSPCGRRLNSDPPAPVQ